MLSHTLYQEDKMHILLTVAAAWLYLTGQLKPTHEIHRTADSAHTVEQNHTRVPQNTDQQLAPTAPIRHAKSKRVYST